MSMNQHTDNAPVIPISRWYAIQTHPRQEDRSQSNLRAWGVETFNPKLKEQHYKPYTRSPISITKHLFPGYIFARFEAGTMFHKVSYTRGVRSIVSFGNKPTPVDDQIIALIRSRVIEDGIVKVREEFNKGDRVLITSGPLQNLVGIFEREMKGKDRVMILLSTISYQGSLQVERSLVKNLIASPEEYLSGARAPRR